MAKLIIVSHRLPYTCSFDQGELELKPSVGGLATGLLPLLQQSAVWIGWHGCSQKLSPSQAQAIDRQMALRGCLALPLPVEKQRIFYNDVSNAIIWPLYHYHADYIPMHLLGWEAYEEINRLYADFIAAHAKAGDTVWIHDYHLQVLPQMLRERDLKVKIGFFLHIPFPAFEVFRILPWREEILEGILGADLVGFHTQSYGKYFREAVAAILGLESEDGSIILDTRRVEIDAFPLGVDFNQWDRKRAPEHASVLASALRNLKLEHPFLRLLLSVDRLDYTKGLPRKLLAFECLLEQHEELRGLVSLVQIAPPSRDTVPAYGRYRKQVEELVGRINGRYGLPGYQPVQYIARSFSSEEISLLYPITDVMVVTPLRDGMNLVAKEFIASRADEDGVLVISELAGASSELEEGLHVNPFDIEKTAAVFFDAVTMDPRERKLRMRTMRSKIESFDTHVWARTFIDRLEGVEEKPEAEIDLPRFQSPKDVALKLFNSNRRLVIFIDYDSALGTQSRQANKRPDPALKILLNRLARSSRCEIHLISAQSPQILKDWLVSDKLHLYAERGGWTMTADCPRPQACPQDAQALVDLERAVGLFESFAQDYPGGTVESWSTGVLWRSSMKDILQIKSLIKRLRERLHESLPPDSFDHFATRHSLELRLRGARPSRLIARRAQSKEASEAFVLIVGDVEPIEHFNDTSAIDYLLVTSKRERGPALYLRDQEAVRKTLRYLDLFLSSSNLQRTLDFAAIATSASQHELRL